jgi:hypothetical protein
VKVTGDVIYSSTRRFEVWDYGVGHRGLLLRSSPTGDESERIELWFKPAYAVCLQSWLENGVRIERSSRSVDLSSDVGVVLGRSADFHELLFTVHGGKSVGWVLAGSVHGRADERQSHEPPMFDGTGPTMRFGYDGDRGPGDRLLGVCHRSTSSHTAR